MKSHAIENINKCHFSNIICENKQFLSSLQFQQVLYAFINPRLALGLSAFRTLLRENQYKTLFKQFPYALTSKRHIFQAYHKKR